MAVPLSPARAADRSTDGGCGAFDRNRSQRHIEDAGMRQPEALFDELRGDRLAAA